MPYFLELIESLTAEEASIQRLFQGDGQSVRGLMANRRNDPRWKKSMAEAGRFIGQVFDGRRPMRHLREAMTTSDFPLLFADTLDRLLLAEYRAMIPTWQRFIKRGTVSDFRSVKRFKSDGLRGRLSAVGQGGTYPEGAKNESYYTFAVSKYGRRFAAAWEALQNDDLDALKQAPRDLAIAARNTEAYQATSLYAANTTLFASHTVAGTAYANKFDLALTLANLKTVIGTMLTYPDPDGEPIDNTPVFLVVPPHLKLTALEILSSVDTQWTGEDAATPTQRVVINILKGMLEPLVDQYLPIVDTSTGTVSWYVFADPNTQGHAAEIAFLTGHEEPQITMKAANQIVLSGGAGNGLEGDFETDTTQWKVRHVVGGSHANATGGWRFAAWSDGS